VCSSDLEAAAKNIDPAKAALKDQSLEVNDVNTFLVMAAMVPGKKVELNEGIRFLKGKGKIDIPLKKKDETPTPQTPTKDVASPALQTGPITTKCTVEEKGKTRTFTITVEPIGTQAASSSKSTPVEIAKPSTEAKAVFSTFAGTVDVVDILVKSGDSVSKGQVVAQVEAMKAQHDIKSQVQGTVIEVFINIGDEIDSTQAILTIG